VGKAVVPWLSESLSRLAAVEGVLRFGHLWAGREFVPGHAPSADPRARLVNLELITTDLTRQRPYRFPLRPFAADDPERLYFRLEDLGARVKGGTLGATDDAIFPLDVIEAMRDPQPITVDGPDGGKLVLHRLPDPWDLPVVFAVRLSMSLPVLFKAVRLYRLVGPTVVRDDLGRPLSERDDDQPLEFPLGRRAEVLWFSDGGITSNFPVHLFDATLPSWPTFGLNLGTHPEGFPHQDVWLPQDWQASIAPATEVGTTIPAFVLSIVDTARSWRDTMQTGMPGSRGRVAWVRQRGDEGGTNLYMPREVVASLALRGALAGARLTRRFDNDTQWTRYRWLRLRVALSNLQVLRSGLSVIRSAYSPLLSSAFLHSLQEGYAFDPYSDQVTWYEPDSPDFWPAAQALLDDFAKATAAGDLLEAGGPEPHPDLGQIPPM
jgi:hypothetical protein